MFLQTINSDVYAFQLAKLLTHKLAIDVPLSGAVDPGEHFQFDPNEKVVAVSNMEIDAIARKEIACVKTADSYRVVLEMANGVIGFASEIPDCVRYATFCCLHEFGHYQQALEWSSSKLKEMADQRDEMRSAIKAKAQALVGKGESKSSAYSMFAERYRSIPIEKDADERACRMLETLVGDLHG